jgi:hypothetical protein
LKSFTKLTGRCDGFAATRERLLLGRRDPSNYFHLPGSLLLLLVEKPLWSELLRFQISAN